MTRFDGFLSTDYLQFDTLTPREIQGGEPPAHVIITLAKVLEVTTDTLLGLEPVDTTTPKDVRLWKKLIKAQELSEKDRKVIYGMIDSLASKQQSAHAGPVFFTIRVCPDHTGAVC